MNEQEKTAFQKALDLISENTKYLPEKNIAILSAIKDIPEKTKEPLIALTSVFYAYTFVPEEAKTCVLKSYDQDYANILVTMEPCWKIDIEIISMRVCINVTMVFSPTLEIDLYKQFTSLNGMYKAFQNIVSRVGKSDMKMQLKEALLDDIHPSITEKDKELLRHWQEYWDEYQAFPPLPLSI